VATANRGEPAGAALSAVVDKLLATYFEQRDQVVDPPLLLSGRDLIDHFGISEGKLIGLLLNRLKEAQATGQITDKAKALEFIESDPDFASYRANEL